MWREGRSFPTLPVTVGVVLVLLLLLATLQYRWIGELGEVERARLRASTHMRTEAVARDFDAEISRVFRELGPSLHDDVESWGARYAAWRLRATWPGLVSAVYRWDPATARLERFDPQAGTFAESSWPTELAGVATAVNERQIRRSGGVGGPGPHPPEGPLLADVPALLIGPHGPGPRGPGRGMFPLHPPPTVPSVVILLLDHGVLAGEMLPALVQRHLGGPDGLEADVRAVRGGPDPREVWRSSTGAWPGTETAVGFFQVRFDEAPRRPRGMAPPVNRGPGPGGGAWRLEVARESGPAAAIVAGVRRRNLAVSFGILLVLGVTVSLAAVSADRARRLAERQMQFVTAVSHELRTPVAVIHSSAENLADGIVKDAAQVESYGATIRDESRRLASMIEDVLQFAGATSRGLPFAPQPVDVGAVVEAALAALDATLAAGRFAVDKQVEDGLPPVRGDAGMLRHALQNLVENAVKYDRGGKWVAVRARSEGTGIVLTVEDHGPGIPRDDVASVFEPFYRGRDARAAQVGGFGLGLALVRRTVEVHGGTVAVATHEGRGTTFTIRLPGDTTHPEGAVDGVPHPSR